MLDSSQVVLLLDAADAVNVTFVQDCGGVPELRQVSGENASVRFGSSRFNEAGFVLVELNASDSHTVVSSIFTSVLSQHNDQ